MLIGPRNSKKKPSKKSNRKRKRRKKEKLLHLAKKLRPILRKLREDKDRTLKQLRVKLRRTSRTKNRSC